MPHSKPQTTWVVVADAARARIFAQAGHHEPLQLIEERHHDLSRLLSSEIASDGKGRSFDSGGQGRHAVEPHTDPQRHEKSRFAKEMAELLNTAVKGHRFDRLVIACPAHMLGDLRKDLDKQATAKVVGEFPKDLTAVALHDLAAHFGDVLTVPDPREAARLGTAR